MMKASLIYILVLITACTMTENKQIEIQGHRGARGLMPENSVPAFTKALELGVNTLEMDVVISKDGKIVVSHEPFFSASICLDSVGIPIAEQKEKKYNIYKMTYEEIKRFDCGIKGNQRFPEQYKTSVYKPLLADVIHLGENFTKAHATSPVFYNIEIKSAPEGDTIFHPLPAEFVQMVYDELKRLHVLDHVILQSFDVRSLQVLKKIDPSLTLALLVENKLSFETNLEWLGFTPQIYSPEFVLVNDSLISKVKTNNMRLIPWTVNEEKDMLRLKEMGVDGIITDYPDRAIKVLR